nr:4Fe-4S binding protein [Candidatus Sigynarchaeota archaeon]
MNETTSQPLIIVDIKRPDKVVPRVRIDAKTCTGCGTCAEVCPFGLPVQAESGKYEIPRPDLCTECSACKKNCPAKAIHMSEQKGCGCLYDVASRRKAKKAGSSCCSG